MLGIMIGIAAVILTVGLGEGAQSSVNSAISALGSNLLVVTPGSTTSSSGFGPASGQRAPSRSPMLTALGSKRVAPNVVAVAPQAETIELLSAGSSNWTTTVVGTTASWAAVRDRRMQEGGFFTRQQVAGADDVAVLGSTTASELFGVESPIDQTINVSGVPLTVIGVMATAGSSSSTNLDDMAVVPITTAQQQLFTGTFASSVSTIYCEATRHRVYRGHTKRSMTSCWLPTTSTSRRRRTSPSQPRPPSRQPPTRSTEPSPTSWPASPGSRFSSAASG